MNAYEHLQVMCSQQMIDDNIESLTFHGERTARFHYINSLKRAGRRMTHSYQYNGEYGHNVYRIIDAGAATTIVFMAHHDVVRPELENCNDNTASCCHLLELARRFSRNRHLLNHNVVCAWVDHEERCSTHLAGSAQLAKQIKQGLFGNVVAVFNLELTACGEYYWYSDENSPEAVRDHLETYQFDDVNCPINDAYHMDRNGVGAVCIGSYRAIDRYIVVEKGRVGCELWRSCHDNCDRADLWAVEREMKTFNDILFSFAFTFESTESVVYDQDKEYVEVKRFYGGRPTPSYEPKWITAPVSNLAKSNAIWDPFKDQDDDLNDDHLAVLNDDTPLFLG